MREVINYKPDIFTRCFCILALPVGYDCQYVSSSCVFAHFLHTPPSTTTQPPSLGGLRQTTPTVVSSFQSYFSLVHVIIIIHISLYLFVYILSSSGQQGAFVLSLEQNHKNANAPWHIQNNHIKELKNILVLFWPLSKTLRKVFTNCIHMHVFGGQHKACHIVSACVHFQCRKWIQKEVWWSNVKWNIRQGCRGHLNYVSSVKHKSIIDQSYFGVIVEAVLFCRMVRYIAMYLFSSTLRTKIIKIVSFKHNLWEVQVSTEILGIANVTFS